MTAGEKNREQPDEKPRRPKRRRRRRLVILLVILASLVWSAPYLASIGAARDRIVSAVNSLVFGRVQIDGLSLTWLGPCRIDGLRVSDTSGREVLNIRQITWSGGLLRGLTSPEEFKEVRLVGLRAVLYISDDGKVSLVEALRLRKPSDKPMPELTGRIIISDGSLQVVQADGQAYPVQQIEGQFDLRTLREVVGSLSWDSAEAYGLVLGEARFLPTLRNDRLDLPVTTIAVSGGKLRIGCVVDFSAAEPVLRISGRLQVAEDVPIDRKIASDLLSRILTIFYEPQHISGRVSLVVEDLVLPLGRSIKHTGSGRGRLTLKDVKIRTGGLLGNLANLGGLNAAAFRPMKNTVLDFVIRDGRIYYDNLDVVLAETFEMKFSGSVGFDDTLDLTVSLLMSLRQLEELRKIIMLEKLGTAVGLEELGRVLGNIPLLGEIPILGRRHVSIRITGTRQKPVLDLLGSLGATLNPKSGLPDKGPESRPATKSPDELLRDILDNLLPK